MNQAAVPPPIVAVPSQDAAKMFADLPLVVSGGKKVRIMGVSLSGEQKLLDSAAEKLRGERWNTQQVRMQTGEQALFIDAGGKTVQQVMELGARAERGEFGKLKTSVASIPDPNP